MVLGAPQHQQSVMESRGEAVSAIHGQLLQDRQEHREREIEQVCEWIVHAEQHEEVVWVRHDGGLGDLRDAPQYLVSRDCPLPERGVSKIASMWLLRTAQRPDLQVDLLDTVAHLCQRPECHSYIR